jgi:hypothetical protein
MLLPRLLALLRPGFGTLRFVFGYGPSDRDAAALPSLCDECSLDALATTYRAAGSIDARVRALDAAEVRALRTTWANKLTFSGHSRRFVEVSGAAAMGFSRRT